MGTVTVLKIKIHELRLRADAPWPSETGNVVELQLRRHVARRLVVVDLEHPQVPVPDHPGQGEDV